MSESKTYEFETTALDPYLVEYWPKIALTLELLWGRNRNLIRLARLIAAIGAVYFAVTTGLTVYVGGDFVWLYLFTAIVFGAFALWFPHLGMIGAAARYQGQLQADLADDLPRTARYTVTPTQLEIEFSHNDTVFDIVWTDVALIVRCGAYFVFAAAPNDYVFVHAQPPMLEHLERTLAEAEVEVHDVNELSGFPEPITPANAYKLRGIRPVAKREATRTDRSDAQKRVA